MNSFMTKVILSDTVNIENMMTEKNARGNSTARKLVPMFKYKGRGIYLPFFYPSFPPLDGVYYLQRKISRKSDSVIYLPVTVSGLLPFLTPKFAPYKSQSRLIGYGVTLNPAQQFTFLENDPETVDIYQNEGVYETKFRRMYGKYLEKTQ